MLLRWLRRIACVLVVIVTALRWGNFEGVGLALLLVAISLIFDRRRSWWGKLGRLAIWVGGFVLAGAIYLATGSGPRSSPFIPIANKFADADEKFAKCFYDLNCSAPFKTYRYPVTWGHDVPPGDWKRFLVCKSPLLD